MIERLAHDHSEVDKLLADLNAYLDSSDFVRSYGAADLFWARLAVHIRAEHLHLFPTVLRALSGSSKSDIEGALSLNEAEKSVESLRDDHDFFMRELSRVVASLRTVATDGAPDDRLAEVRRRIDAVKARLLKHNQIEEQGIYLWVATLLNETGKEMLAKEVAKELDNMPPRFDG